MTLILAANETVLDSDRGRACQAAAGEAVRTLINDLVRAGWSPQEAALAINALSWTHLLEAAVGRRKFNTRLFDPPPSARRAE
jgi:hypothetical protein